MLFFLVGQAITVLLVALTIPSVFEPFAQPAWDDTSVIPLYHATIVMEMLFSAARLAFPVAGIILTVTRDRRAPRFWLAYLGLVVVGSLLDTGAGIAIHNWMQAELPASAEAVKSMTRAIVENLRTVMWALVWSLYWINSERVWITFGRGGWSPPSDTPWLPPGAVVVPAEA